MKVFKLKGLDFYVAAFSVEDAILLCLLNKIGITENDITEVSIDVDREAIGQVFRNYEELSPYIEQS